MNDEDVLEYMKNVMEGLNVELGEAYASFGNCERALGKLADAEGYYKVVVKVVEDDGLELFFNKFVF